MTPAGVSVALACGVGVLELVALGVSSRVAVVETVRARVAESVGLAAEPEEEPGRVGVTDSICAWRVEKTAVHSGGKVGKALASLAVGTIDGINGGVGVRTWSGAGKIWG